MGSPVRVQLSRAKGWRMPPNTVKVDRSTRWGNLYTIRAPGMWDRWRVEGPGLGAHPASGLCGNEEGARLLAVRLFRQSVEADDASAYRATVRSHLAGKNLACWCKAPAPGEPDICHAVVLLELANAAPTEGVGEAAAIMSDDDVLEFWPMEGPDGAGPHKIFRGLSPWDFTDRQAMTEYLGRRVRIQGRVWRILSFETFTTMHGPRIGVPLTIRVESAEE